ncbi:glycoside hydrolase domain-containing protein, partial [Saccharothrix sp. Mg75]|uniref:glycoside hydrolase domain-containing protein n=1 Tax=Saccharothrix sp. Mg75 TaxID=3445357 RepID=UPI003EE8FACA
MTAYGLDYSARELSPAEIDDYNRRTPNQPISFLIRYIGYPGNRKCISAYPGALRAHEAGGRVVLLVHQIGYTDFHGGRAAGRAHANTAWADARAQGYPDTRPIFFAFDRWLSGNPQAGPLTLGQVWDYLQGAIDVLGFDRVGLYGFFDVVHPAVREGRVRWTWLCGAESNVIDGVSFYQWNNGRVYPGGLECDLNKAYVDLSTLGGEDMNVWDLVGFRPNRNQNLWDGLEQIQQNQAVHTELLAAIVNDPDITPEALDAVVDKAVAKHTPTAEQVALTQLPHLQAAVREVLGEGSEDKADEIVVKLVQRLT